MATTKISVTVDTATLREIRRLAGAGVNLSALVGEALQNEVRRRGLLELLDEMDRESPISAEGHAAGERLWKRILSSTPERSQRSPKKTKPSASRSARR